MFEGTEHVLSGTFRTCSIKHGQNGIAVIGDLLLFVEIKGKQVHPAKVDADKVIGIMQCSFSTRAKRATLFGSF